VRRSTMDHKLFNHISEISYEFIKPKESSDDIIYMDSWIEYKHRNINLRFVHNCIEMDKYHFECLIYKVPDTIKISKIYVSPGVDYKLHDSTQSVEIGVSTCMRVIMRVTNDYIIGIASEYLTRCKPATTFCTGRRKCVHKCLCGAHIDMRNWIYQPSIWTIMYTSNYDLSIELRPANPQQFARVIVKPRAYKRLFNYRILAVRKSFSDVIFTY
jgi:hypothetical protein